MPQRTGKGETTMDEERRKVGGGILVGLAIIAFGVVLLLDQEGVVPASHILRFWPLLLVAWGLSRALRGEGTRERLWGLTILAVGGVYQLSELGYKGFEFGRIWPFWLIAFGLWILYAGLGGHKKLDVWTRLTGSGEDDDLNRVDIFGGGKLRVTSRHFRGGRWLAIFGGSEIDFTEADIEGNEAAIEVTAIFGGGEIRVPQSWEVRVRGAAFFGGHNDETRPPVPTPAAPRKKLLIRGAWVFGGFNVKN